MRLIDADKLKEEIRENDPFGGMNYEWYIDHAPTIDTVSPWHRVEDDSEFLSLIISDICSYSVENGMEPDNSLRTVAQNILELLEISTFNNWMPIEPPKEDA